MSWLEKNCNILFGLHILNDLLWGDVWDVTFQHRGQAPQRQTSCISGRDGTLELTPIEIVFFLSTAIFCWTLLGREQNILYVFVRYDIRRNHTADSNAMQIEFDWIASHHQRYMLWLATVQVVDYDVWSVLINCFSIASAIGVLAFQWPDAWSALFPTFYLPTVISTHGIWGSMPVSFSCFPFSPQFPV